MNMDDEAHDFGQRTIAKNHYNKNVALKMNFNKPEKVSIM